MHLRSQRIRLFATFFFLSTKMKKVCAQLGYIEFNFSWIFAIQQIKILEYLIFIFSCIQRQYQIKHLILFTLPLELLIVTKLLCQR